MHGVISMRKYQAFTLVEMSVVITIIGLIIGGVMVGVSLVDRSRKQATISDLQKFDQAIANFNSKYLGYPGDISVGSSIFGDVGCSVACNGNGNNIIEFRGPPTEANQAWEHLSLAGLISQYARYNAGYVIDKNIPSAPVIGAGYWLVNKMQIFVGASQSAANSNYFDAGIFTPDDVRYFDDKIDDGRPGTGIIQARTDQYGYTNVCIDQNFDASLSDLASANYVMTTKTSDCFMIYVTTSGSGQGPVTYPGY